MTDSIPHGTRTGYRKHACRCLECVSYQRGLAKRGRDKAVTNGACLDCHKPLTELEKANGHRRHDTCQEKRNARQRGEYRPRPVKPRTFHAFRVTVKPEHRQKEVPKAPESWWMRSECQTDRGAFTAAAAARVAAMQATGVSYRWTASLD